MSECPSPHSIERLVAGEETDAAVLDHVRSCSACQDRMALASDDAKFISKARDLLHTEPLPLGIPRIHGYRDLLMVSSGTQGVVYRAVQESTLRRVAIKVLSAGRNATVRQRLRAQREAEIAARLKHTSIVTVYESRVLADGRIAVVMEFVNGVPLDQWKPPGATPAQQRRALLAVFVRVCDGIHHAHLSGVIHRDLKPANILITSEGRPVVVDFGIAKAEDSRSTRTGEFAGTPAYASPEQVSGRPQSVNALTDVYSIGVIIYQAMSGKLPYSVDGSIFEVARNIVDARPRPLALLVPEIDTDLDAIVGKALQKSQSDRYQSAAALAADIERYLAGRPVEARSSSGWYLLRKAISVNRASLIFSAIGLCLIVGAIALVAVTQLKSRRLEREALLQTERARAERVRTRAVSELLRESIPTAERADADQVSLASSGMGRLFYRLETGAFVDDPAVDQELRRLWARTYANLGSSRIAGMIAYSEWSLRNGLVRLRSENQTDTAEIATTLHDLAAILIIRNRFPEAERIARESLEIHQRLSPQSTVPIAESRAVLARALFENGRYEDALTQASEAETSLKAAPDASPSSIASLASLQARLLALKGDAPGAEAFLREALTLRLKDLAPDDPEVLSTLIEMVRIVSPQSSSPLGDAVRAIWGPDPAGISARVRHDVQALAAADRNTPSHVVRTGRPAALGRILQLQEYLFGPDHPALLQTLTAQVRAATAEREPEIRIAAAQRTYQIVSRRFGLHDFAVSVCVQDVASVLAYCNRTAEAIPLARQAVAIWEAVPDRARDAALYANAQRLLAWFLAMNKQYPEAAKEYSKAIACAQGADVPAHLLAGAEAGLAFCEAQSGNREHALELSERALKRATDSPATPLDQLAHIQFARAFSLLRAGQTAAAKPLLAQAWVIYELSGVDMPWRQRLIEEMQSIAQAEGDAAALARWTKELTHEPAMDNMEEVP